MPIEVKTVHPDWVGEARRGCTLCGGNRVIKAEIKFKTGTTAQPAVAAVLTGGTSGDTGVCEVVEIYSGTFAAGTAAGYITMTSPTGLDDDRHWGTNGETVSYTGGTVVLDGEGFEKSYGIMYPESELIEFRGRWYCKPHYLFRWRQALLDERTINLKEAE